MSNILKSSLLSNYIELCEPPKLPPHTLILEVCYKETLSFSNFEAFTAPRTELFSATSALSNGPTLGIFANLFCYWQPHCFHITHSLSCSLITAPMLINNGANVLNPSVSSQPFAIHTADKHSSHAVCHLCCALIQFERERAKTI
jgi:hypothetical protein